MNYDQIITSVAESEVETTRQQVKAMESEEVSVLGPMNMLAFDN